MSATIDFYRNAGDKRDDFKERMQELTEEQTRQNIEDLGRALGVPMQCFSAEESTEISESTTEVKEVLKDAYKKVQKAKQIAETTQ